MHVLLHQHIQRGEIASHSGFRKRQRNLRSDIRNAGRIRLHTDREVSRNAIVTESAEPRQPVAVVVHDALVFLHIALPVFPRRKRRYMIGKPRYLIGRKHGPIAAVNHHRQRRRFPDRFVVIEQPRLRCIGIVRRQNQQAFRPGLLYALRHFAANGNVESRPSHHRHLAIGGLHGDFDHLLHFAGIHGVQLPGAAGGNQSAEWIPHHLLHVARQAVKV